ncbi:MAG: N-acetylglucosamine-6-phosphate deacetylase [Bauldia sp.]|nr:N-acetylglucosamine-6-phosphate deacetylase [Bauldia sp.]
MAFALAGARIFDGASLAAGRVVVIDQGRITAVLAETDIPAGVPVRRIEGLLAPGFIDIQVNGGGGVLLNDEPTVEGVRAIAEAHRRYGTTGLLPTLVTDTRERMAEAIAAVRGAIAAGVPGVLGIHLEGPYLNPIRKGVHDPALMRRIEEADIALVTSLDRGVTLITIAPELTTAETIRRIADAGVRIAAGHTAASYEEIEAARAAGLTGITHLFNAMPPLMGREPGVLGAALDDPGLYPSLIVDLFHVSAASLRVALAARGTERTILVTDAMSTVGSDIDHFMLGDRVITRAAGRLTTADGTLAGSDLDMASAVRNTVEALGLPLEAALHMASGAPAAFLGLDAELGRIAPGYRASIVLLDDDLAVTDTWIDGVDTQGNGPA